MSGKSMYGGGSPATVCTPAPQNCVSPETVAVTGYVKRTNNILQQLHDTKDKDKALQRLSVLLKEIKMVK